MGRGRFKAKPTGRRNFSTPEEMAAGSSARPRTFKKKEAEYSEEEEPGEESGGDSEQETEKKKGILHISEIQNPNLVKPKNMKARAADVESTPELSRREREEIERQKAHERYMRLQEQGKTEQARKDLGNNHASTLLFTLSLSLSLSLSYSVEVIRHHGRGSREGERENRR